MSTQSVDNDRKQRPTQHSDPTQAEKKVFNEPKLKFIEPKLTKQGDATKITHGFFGTFEPDP
jgi:hypothetical protein